MKILSSFTKTILYIPWQIKNTFGMACINDNRILIFGLTIPLMDWVLNMHYFIWDAVKVLWRREKESSSTWHNEELYDLSISEEGCCMKGSSLISVLWENEEKIAGESDTWTERMERWLKMKSNHVYLLWNHLYASALLKVDKQSWYTFKMQLFLWCKSWIFSSHIFSVFSITWSFRNHSNMLIWCSINVSYDKRCWKI